MKTSAILTAIVLLVGVGEIAAQEGWNVEMVGSLEWPGEEAEGARAVALSGDLAYVASGESGLRVVDISEPARPREVGVWDQPGYARGIVISGNYAYLAHNWYGLRVIDISDPGNPRRVGWICWQENTWGVAVSGNYAYLANFEFGLRVIDVSNAGAPREVASVHTPGHALQVTVSGNYVYLSAMEAGLRIIDVSDPTRPREVATVNTHGSANDVAVLGTYAYLADGEAGLRVIDITDPTNPEEVGFYDTPVLTIGRVAVAGNYAYLMDWENGLRVIDISNPVRPFEVGFHDTQGMACGLAVSGSYAYVAKVLPPANDISNSLLIMDYSQAQRASAFPIPLRRCWNILSSVCAPANPTIPVVWSEIVSSGHLLQVKDQNGNFFSPANDFNNIPPWDVRQGYMAKLTDPDTLVIVNIPVDPETPISLRENWNITAYFPTYELDASRPDFYVLSPIIDHVVMAKDNDGSFLVPRFNFSNMPPWRETQGYQVKVDADVVLNYPPEQDEMASALLRPGNEDEQSHWTSTPTGENMSVLVTTVRRIDPAVDGQIAAFNSDGQVIGTGTISSDGMCGLAVWGDDESTDQIDGLLPGETFTLKAWDAKQGRELQLSTITTLEGAGLIYEPDGLTVLEMATETAVPEEFFLSEAYPNPFNAFVRLSYGLPEAADAAISVYDLNGRLVTTLVSGKLDAGYHTVVWDGNATASGIYFVRMSAGDFKGVRKVTLVK